jgi:hypothetical protein
VNSCVYWIIGLGVVDLIMLIALAALFLKARSE